MSLMRVHERFPCGYTLTAWVLGGKAEARSDNGKGCPVHGHDCKRGA